MIIEGVDTFGIGLVGPYLSKQLRISAEQLGVVYSGTVIASLLGAVLLAPLADRFGKRTVLLSACAIMGPATLITPIAPNSVALYLVRFAIGLAFGATLPTIIALVADYAPAARRAFLVMLINSGISLGVMVAGVGSAYIIPHMGWHWMLYASAILSVVFFALLWFLLPESLQFLMRTEPESRRTKRILAQLLPHDAALPARQIVSDELPRATIIPTGLVLGGQFALTALLWFITSITYISINFDSYWLPTALLMNGASTAGTGFIVSAGKFCGLFCGLIVGWIADRRGLVPVVGWNYLGTGILILSVGLLVNFPVAVVIAIVAALGSTSAAVAGNQALIVSSYPDYMRTTAMGWITGFARLCGGTVGTIAGGYLMDTHVSGRYIAMMISTIYLVDGVLVLLMNRYRRDKNNLEAVPVAKAAT
jgi:AAHS family 4-hydroxybenzoate transporter-like MFS transporter